MATLAVKVWFLAPILTPGKTILEGDKRQIHDTSCMKQITGASAFKDIKKLILGNSKKLKRNTLESYLVDCQQCLGNYEFNWTLHKIK